MISSSMNLVMTVLGFAVSATFIVFVCARLLCARVQRRRGRRAFSTASTTRTGFGIDVRSIERSLNGIEPATVATFPTFKYSQEVFPSREDALCTVCLNDYAEKEILRLLPWCGHAFHTDCIDAWLRAHSTCPICRVSLRDSPDRRHLALPQMNPAIRWRFSPESLLELAGSARGVVNEEHVTANLEELQGIQRQHGDRRWNSDVFELGNDDREGLVARQQADLSLQRWSFRLWRRPRETSPAGDRAMPQNLGTESSVTININIGHLPAAEVAPCTGIPQEVTAGLGDDGRGAVAADGDDISISLQSSHCDIVESSSSATVTTGDVKDVSTGDSANVSGMNSVQQQQENIESGGVSQQRHNSRPVNLSIELNVCDGGIFGYSKAHQ